MPIFPRLIPPAPAELDTRVQYAARLFAWVLANGSPAVCALDLDACELAEYGARVATDRRDASPEYYAAIAECQRWISGRARAIRAVDAAELARKAPAACAPSTPAGRPNAGPMAPILPRPSTRPPSGSAVRIDF